MDKTTLTMAKAEELIQTLKERFESHVSRHPSVTWAAVEARLRSHATKL